MDPLAMLDAHAALAELVLRGAAEDDLTRAAVDVVAEQVGADRACLLELCPHDTRLVVRAGFGWPDARAAGATIAPGLAAHAWCALEARGAVVVDDTRATGSAPAVDLLATGDGMRSGVAVAVRVEGHTFGVLTAHARRRAAFGAAQVRFVAAIARLLALATRRSVRLS
jgi:GAF domain-containing protein